MRALGDIDTVCFDIMMVATAVMTWRLRREVRGNAPYLIFSISLALMLTLLMAYIVTNVGTLVRLRLMLAVPFWTLTFAFARLPRLVGGDAIDQPNDAFFRRGATIAGPIEKKPV